MSNIKVGTKNESTRVDWLKATLKEVPEGARLLDAGAGERQFQKFCEHLEYVSQDFAQYQPKAVDMGLQMEEWNYDGLDIVSDITAIPELDASFDAILCTEVFEHIPDPISALREFSRLLKKEGLLIITAPFCSITHFAPYHFYTGFNRFFYERHLSEMGFEILDQQANGNFFEYVAQEVQRIPFIATKYAKDQPSRLERFAISIVLKMLGRFSHKGGSSSELLNFGLHILARKR